MPRVVNRNKSAGHWPLAVRTQSGQIIIISLAFLTFTTIIATALFARAAGFLKFGGNTIMREQAINVAEAGVDFAILKLNETGGSYTGTGATPINLTAGSFTIIIQEKNPPNPQLKTIIATGLVPNSANPLAKKTIKLDTLIDSATIAFRYAVQIGTGGVDMENATRVNGTVYSNGSITGAGSARIAGDAYAAGAVSNPPCAPPPDPVPCLEFENQPIQPLPTINYDNWRNAAASGGTTTCSPTCEINGPGSFNIGPQKYTGNLTIGKSGDPLVTVKGAIWVENGDFTVEGGGTQVKLDNSFGSNGTVIIVDGKVKVTNGAKFLATNANPKGYIVVTTTSTSDPADLTNCNDTPTPAMLICNAGDEAVFYTIEGKAELMQSADVTALVAKTLSMRNDATLTYDTGLASANFSSGPGGSWQAKKGTYRITN